jgi:hypothetical protein
MGGKTVVQGAGGKSQVVNQLCGSCVALDVFRSLGEDLQARILSRFEADDFPQTVELATALIDMFESREPGPLLNAIHRLLDYERSCCQRQRAMDSLQAQVDEMSVEHLRLVAMAEVQGDSGNFIAQLVNRLTNLYEEFKILTDEYSDLLGDLEEEKQTILDDGAVLSAELMAESFAERFMTASSQVIMVRSGRLAFAVMAESHPFFEQIYNQAAAIRQRADQLNVKIDRLGSAYGSDFRRRMAEVRQNIQNIKAAFIAAKSESFFYGLVFGLHEIEEFSPMDLGIYRIHDALVDFDWNRLENYMFDYLALLENEVKKAKDVPAPVVSEKARKKNEEIKDSKSDAPTTAVTKNVHNLPDVELEEMYLAAVFCFVIEKYARYLAEGKPHDKAFARANQFGKKQALVARLLSETGYVNDADRSRLTRVIAPRLVEQGLIVVSEFLYPGHRSRSGSGEMDKTNKIYLTEKGFVSGQALNAKYMEMMTAVFKYDAQRREDFGNRVKK